MTQLTLFDDDPPLAPQASRLAPKLQMLARNGICFGTSSWKYEGWLGSIYDPERYKVRGKVSVRKFEHECLAEYGRVFPIAGGDFSFYQFPSSEYWRTLFETAPSGLRFGLKVPEDITVAIWPGHARYGRRAGMINDHFLDARLFRRAFLDPLAPYADRVAVLMFEFGTFAKKVLATPADFIEKLRPFLLELPADWSYGIEIRNPNYLIPAYFDLLAKHNVAHVFNAWTRMPELDEQAAIPGAHTANFTVIRALLGCGHTYEQAVAQFQPYERLQNPRPRVRAAMILLAQRSRDRKEPYYAFVNNRLEGNAPTTIEAIADEL